MQKHAVVVVPHAHVAPRAPRGLGAQQHGETLIHPPAERAVQHHLVLAGLILEIFLHQRLVGGKAAVHGQLILQIPRGGLRGRLIARESG